jgi:hypothetical protein
LLEDERRDRQRRLPPKQPNKLEKSLTKKEKLSIDPPLFNNDDEDDGEADDSDTE